MFRLNFFLVLFVLLNGSMMVKAQNNILLSKYTFGEKDREVALIYPINASEKLLNITLKGENADKFQISDKNKLSIKKGFNKADALWYDLEIEAETSAGRQVSSFRIVKDNFIRNKVIAHRGAWKNTHTPENSIASLKKAIELGCEGSEFDVHLSADSVLLINHDPHIKGMNVQKSNWEQLSKVKLSKTESLPSLQQFINAGISQNKTKLILEIKPSVIGQAHALKTARAVVALVREMKAQAWVDYISFDYEICKEVIQQDPFAKVAYLKGELAPEVLAKDKLTGLDYHFSVIKQNEGWIDSAKNNKITTNVWTVNDEETMKWLLDKKVDFITTNEPETLLKLVGRK